MKKEELFKIILVLLAGIILGFVIGKYSRGFSQARLGFVDDRVYQGHYINWNTGESSTSGN